jgi:hypothetical protein
MKPARPGRRFAWVAPACVLALVAGAIAIIRDSSPERSPSPASAALVAGELPAPRRPAFTFGRVRPLRPARVAMRWSPVLKAVSVRARPSFAAPVVGALRARTSLGTTNIVSVVGHRRSEGRLWVKVRFPGLPGTPAGWLRRDAIGGYHFVRTRLVVDLDTLMLRLFRDGRQIFRAPVGVGTDAHPTPPGSFYVRERLTEFDNPFYGPIAFGTSARSAVLTDWPDGGSIGIHGTNRPDLIPGRISHGCIRLRNEDILRLSRLLPVGTPLTIS